MGHGPLGARQVGDRESEAVGGGGQYDGDGDGGDALGRGRRREAQLQRTVGGDRAAQHCRERSRVRGRGRLHDHLGLAGQLLEGPLDEHTGAVHDDQSAGQTFRLGELVGRYQQGATAVALGADDLAHHLAPLGVHAGGRFVEHEHSGPAEQCEREQRALLLPAAQSAPRRARTALEVEHCEQLARVARRAVVRGRQGQYLRGRHGEPDAAALQQRPGAHDDLAVVAHGIEPVESDGTLRRGTEPEQRLDHGGLAGAVGAEQGHHLAVVHVQADVVDGEETGERDLQVTDLDGVAHDL